MLNIIFLSQYCSWLTNTAGLNTESLSENGCHQLRESSQDSIGNEIRRIIIRRLQCVTI